MVAFAGMTGFAFLGMTELAFAGERQAPGGEDVGGFGYSGLTVSAG